MKEIGLPTASIYIWLVFTWPNCHLLWSSIVVICFNFFQTLHILFLSVPRRYVKDCVCFQLIPGTRRREKWYVYNGFHSFCVQSSSDGSDQLAKRRGAGYREGLLYHYMQYLTKIWQNYDLLSENTNLCKLMLLPRWKIEKFVWLHRWWCL